VQDLREIEGGVSGLSLPTVASTFSISGHLRYLEKAKALGDILVVGVNSDASVQVLKGSRRPVLPLEERMELLSGLECVDYVVSFDEPTPLELITALKPHTLVKGGDWGKENIVGKEVVESLGVKWCLFLLSRETLLPASLKRLSSVMQNRD